MKLIRGDCLEEMKKIPDNSIDALVSDPPYELGFMGKSWDNTGIAYNIELWKECLRVLKPGAYLLAFGGTRTYHRMACAIEDAGFEIRDMIEWTYGSGFPKSLNIGKAVDKIQGNKREVVGKKDGTYADIRSGSLDAQISGQRARLEVYETKGTSEWEGWGTALKPAHEPIVMARKPLAEKTVVENVLKYGTGGINIDESRVGTEGGTKHEEGEKEYENEIYGKGLYKAFGKTVENLGRFPANLIHDGSEEVLKEFEKAGISKGTAGNYIHNTSNDLVGFGIAKNRISFNIGDSGTPARFFKTCEFTEQDFEYAPFFYCAKASKSERNDGCEELEDNKQASLGIEKICNKCGLSQRHAYEEQNKDKCEHIWEHPIKKNNHPTVKPLKLMEYLIKMVTPKGGVVLDPFAGSGTTLVASKKLGYKYIGIELTKEYIPIIEARLEAVK